MPYIVEGRGYSRHLGRSNRLRWERVSPVYHDRDAAVAHARKAAAQGLRYSEVRVRKTGD